MSILVVELRGDKDYRRSMEGIMLDENKEQWQVPYIDSAKMYGRSSQESFSDGFEKLTDQLIISCVASVDNDMKTMKPASIETFLCDLFLARTDDPSQNSRHAMACHGSGIENKNKQHKKALICCFYVFFLCFFFVLDFGKMPWRQRSQITSVIGALVGAP